MSSWSEYADKFDLPPSLAKIMAALSEGDTPKTTEFLQVHVLGVKFASANLIPQHIYRLRQRLKDTGYSVVAGGRGRHSDGYRLVSKVLS